MRRRASDTPALCRFGTITPLPFVGREPELDAASRLVALHPVVVVQGPAGAGKTRLGRELAARMSSGALRPAMIRCLPGDQGIAMRARAERTMDIMPGTLAEALATTERVLIIDDAHLLTPGDCARLVAQLAAASAPAPVSASGSGSGSASASISGSGSGSGSASASASAYGPAMGMRGRLLLLTRETLPLYRDGGHAELCLDGLDEASAGELWSHLEHGHGPTRHGAGDRALMRARGLPLALRREYARAVFGNHAWTVATLDPAARAVVEALAVVRVPAAPAALAALGAGEDTEHALMDLVARQLVDCLEDGRFQVHDLVRDHVLAAMEPGRQRQLEHQAAELFMASGSEATWDAGDDGAFGRLDPVEQLCHAVRHLMAAGDTCAAHELLIREHRLGMRRGGDGEILALVDALALALAPAGQSTSAGEQHRELAALQAGIAARHGRVAEALEIVIALGAGGGGGFDTAVTAAELAYRAGDVAGARRQLGALVGGADVEARCRAAAVLAEIELACANPVQAESLVVSAFKRDRGASSDSARARLHVALAAVEEHAGRISAARAALSRAASSGRIEPSLAACIEARRAVCLAREGRLSEAEVALSEAERAAREIDAVAVADQVRHCRSIVSLRRGDTLRATQTLRELTSVRRRRGDEIGALAAEIDLARVLIRRGELSAAAELVSACITSAERRKLGGMLAAAELAGAAIDMAELRLGSATAQLERLAAPSGAAAEIRDQAAMLLTLARAHAGEPAGDPSGEPHSEIIGSIDRAQLRAQVAMARGDSDEALEACRLVSVLAERAGRMGDLADALVMVARLAFARGDRGSAFAAAVRAARDSQTCGLSHARAGALLVLAALARHDRADDSALAHAREAVDLARHAGLPIERLVASEAMVAISAGSLDCAAGDLRSTALATMSQPGLDAAARVLGDLGLTVHRPYRVITAGGSETFVATANPEPLRMFQRSLAIDGVHETIIRDGEQIADLRRRTLLKRLLYLFAAAPGHIFAKEEIVQTVWNVDYHPLRHDAALFTNIMRIRRILGEDGADLIRVSEDGYRFVPPKDFLYMTPVAGG